MNYIDNHNNYQNNISRYPDTRVRPLTPFKFSIHFVCWRSAGYQGTVPVSNYENMTF